MKRWQPALAILCLILTILVLFVMVRATHASTSQITGTLTDSFGNGISGQLILQLPVPATDITSGKSVAPTPITCRLLNGVVSNCPPVYDVANLQPQNLYYSARVYDSSGTLVFNGNYPITGVTYNLFSAIPTTVTTSNISYVNPAVTNATNTFCCTQIFQGQIQSTLATGTAPFSIASTTLVPNLNVNVLNGVTVTGTPSAGQAILATGAAAANWQNIPPQLSAIANNGGVGTVAGLLAKLTGAPSTATPTLTSDTGGAIGICTSGCGNTGTGQFTTVGQASCTFDGATTAGDYVQISATVGGNCHDVGASYPASGQVVGRVLSTNGGNGLYNMVLFGVEIQGAVPTKTIASPFTNKVLAGNVGVTANVDTLVDSIAVTMPASGGPWRAFVNYGYYGSGGVNGMMYVTDATSKWDTSMGGTLNNNFSIFGTGGYSPTTYANGANITFSVRIVDTGAITVCTATAGGAPCNTGQTTTAVSSYMQVALVSSN